MKNKEKFSKEIFDIACRGDSIAITITNNEIVPCESIECENVFLKQEDMKNVPIRLKNGVNQNISKDLLLHQKRRNSLV